MIFRANNKIGICIGTHVFLVSPYKYPESFYNEYEFYKIQLESNRILNKIVYINSW